MALNITGEKYFYNIETETSNQLSVFLILVGFRTIYPINACSYSVYMHVSLKVHAYVSYSSSDTLHHCKKVVNGALTACN